MHSFRLSHFMCEFVSMHLDFVVYYHTKMFHVVQNFREFSPYIVIKRCLPSGELECLKSVYAKEHGVWQ